MGIDIFGTRNDTFVGWQTSPNTRGTWDIITSCLATTLLCVWTAIHVNIPDANDQDRPWWKRQQLRSKLGCMSMAVLMPEVMLSIAISQFIEAGRIAHAVNQWTSSPEQDTEDTKSGSTHSSEDPYPEHLKLKWTRTQGFYVAMGGLRFDVSEHAHPFLFDHKVWSNGKKKRHYTLLPQGFLILLKYAPHLIPDCPKENIQDRSKTSALTRVLVSVQAMWFCFQIVARLICKLPITLLELNTLAHAACALIMYLVWWHKPYDVDRASTIRGRGKDEACAFLGCRDRGLYEQLLEILNLSETYSATTDRSVATDLWNQGSIRLAPGMPIPGTMLRVADISGSETGSSEKYLSPKEVRLLQLSWSFWKSFGDHGASMGSKTLNEESSMYLDLMSPDRRANVRSFWTGSWQQSVVYTSFLVIMSLIYGAFHALAWTSDFHSNIERNLWRVAVIVIMAVPPTTVALLIILAIFDKYICLLPDDGRHGRMLTRRVSAMLGLYLIVRSYLIVECFAALRDLPEGVYTMSQFPSYIPHF